MLGAHPFWSEKIAFIGAPLGAILGYLLGRSARIVALLSCAVLLIISFVAAHWGKTEFAASFAENQRAGQIWYFGWIATALFATALLATLMRKVMPE